MNARTRVTHERRIRLTVIAWLVSYVVGSALSYGALRRTLGGLGTPALARFLVRMVIACAAAGLAAWGIELALAGLGDRPGILLSLLRGGLAGLAGGLVLLLAARVLRIREITSLSDVALARLRRG